MTEVLVARARAGDDRAFRDLIEPYRRELHLHCYRLLGSLTDAEDVLQEALLAAWRGLAGFEERASMRTCETAVKGALQRARATLDRGRPARDRTAAGSAAERELSRRFATAFADRDLGALLGQLTDDAWLAMPPAPHEYHGRPAIAAFLRASSTWRADLRLRLVPVGANRQPAFGCYLTGPGEEAAPDERAAPGEQTGRPAGIIVLTVREGGIHGLTRFLDERLPDRFWPAPTRVGAAGLNRR